MDTRCPACATRWRAEVLDSQALQTLDCPRCGGSLADAPLVFGLAHRSTFSTARVSRQQRDHATSARSNGTPIPGMSTMQGGDGAPTAVLEPPPSVDVFSASSLRESAGDSQDEMPPPIPDPVAATNGLVAEASSVVTTPDAGSSLESGPEGIDGPGGSADEDPAGAGSMGDEIPESLDTDPDPSSTVLIPSPFPPESPLDAGVGNDETGDSVRVEKRIRLGLEGAEEGDESDAAEQSVALDLPLSASQSSPFLLRGGIAGAVIGLLSGFGYLLVFAGIDWTSAPTLGLLWSLPSATVVWIGGLLLAGIALGVIISWLTRSGGETPRR